MTYANIENFLQNGLNNNGARPSRFLCQVTVPTPLLGNAGVSKFTWTCKAASIPSFQIGIVNAGYMGRTIKLSGDRTWDNWQTQVLLDEDYATRNMFEAWNQGMNDFTDNTLSSTYFPYKATINILHLSQLNKGSDTIIGNYQLIGAWPAAIGPIALNWDQRDTVAEYGVTFAFDNCIPTPESSISATSTTGTGQNLTVTPAG